MAYISVAQLDRVRLLLRRGCGFESRHCNQPSAFKGAEDNLLMLVPVRVPSFDSQTEGGQSTPTPDPPTPLNTRPTRTTPSSVHLRRIEGWHPTPPFAQPHSGCHGLIRQRRTTRALHPTWASIISNRSSISTHGLSARAEQPVAPGSDILFTPFAPFAIFAFNPTPPCAPHPRS